MRLARWTALVMAMGIIAFLGACSDNNTGTPVVTVTGNFNIPSGTASQMTATTTNGNDSGYSWRTSDPDVATVDQNGLVMAGLPGQCLIYALGANSNVEGSIGIVVPENPPEQPPQFAEWMVSGHADESAEAFRHWDDDGEIPTSCAKCHSTHGYRDFLGDDGTEAGVVNNPAALGTTVECDVCHNDTAVLHEDVTFPSGVTLQGLGKQANCHECHQGRSSKDDVDEAIDDSGAPDDDSVTGELGFINVHYFAAAATRWAGVVRGGYMYDGKNYDIIFRHVPGLENCNDCHNPHTLAVRLDVCAACHDDESGSFDDLKNIRMESSLTRDYDGDGDLEEGIFYEIDTLRGMLEQAFQAYGREVVNKPIVYAGYAYPYFFNDLNDNGIADPDEVNYGNRYKSWTGRLVRATYNFQYAQKDTGGFAHNAKFIIQLLHDSIEDLNGQIGNPIDLQDADRDDAGHFDGTAEAFRHWDDDGEVEASCAKCHSGSFGYEEYLTYKANTEQDIENGLNCATCHTTFDDFQTRFIESVEFPSGKTTPPVNGQDPSEPGVQSNMCIVCHSGRTSGVQIDEAIESNQLKFLNVHYLAAAATLFGTDAMVGYEYEGKTYAGKFPHEGNINNCTQCHNPETTMHTFHADDNIAFCRSCHEPIAGAPIDSVHEIRVGSDLDYNGNGNSTEPLDDEVQGMAEELYRNGIQQTARDNGFPIVYEGSSYPYFFNDLNDNGEVDPGEAIFPNRYTKWTGELMKAAHNYQQSQKEHGAWAHNFAYIGQLIYDSLEDLQGAEAVEDLIRPSNP